MPCKHCLLRFRVRRTCLKEVRTMNNKTFWLSLLILTMILSVSCSSADQGGGEPTVNVGGTTVPARIKLATANVGGSYYPVGNAIAEVLSKNIPGVLATAETSGGSTQNIRMLDGNQIHLGMSNASITFPAIKGI